MAVTVRKRFFQVAPLDQEIYTTLELYHPDIGVKRYVLNQLKPKLLQLEAGAPINAGEVVEFQAVNGVAPEPEQGEFGASLEVNFGSVGLQFKQEMNNITDVGRRTPAQLTWRQHLSGVATPDPVFYFQVETAAKKSRFVGIKAQQVNTASRNVSRRYKADEFIGLSVSI